jgi:hypothetical protein
MLGAMLLRRLVMRLAVMVPVVSRVVVMRDGGRQHQAVVPRKRCVGPEQVSEDNGKAVRCSANVAALRQAPIMRRTVATSLALRSLFLHSVPP